ncbi:hypothetical protein [Paracoccus saliphilus]|uniref:Uncharacterized protein n=1 Tax=Paracoccus saliphilus TaxID=405559 RepID=A0AA46A614_9RHOB|nr:hypothetical protein [Paracoccus saliphilus]WCR02151.1 hypothetical protein JHX88_14735 [Paracoccus saliphilus]SIS90537.1 hypothetical protein SAMN05421772_10866 [Paracoccus saliphilus]
MSKTEIDHVKSHNLRVQSLANFSKNIALVLWGAAELGAYLHRWDAIRLIVGEPDWHCFDRPEFCPCHKRRCSIVM